MKSTWGNKMKTKKQTPKAHFKYKCSICGFVATTIKEKDIKDGEPCWQVGCTGTMKRMDNRATL